MRKKRKQQNRLRMILIIVVIIAFCIGIAVSAGYWVVYFSGSSNGLRTWIVSHTSVNVAKVNHQGIRMRDFEARVADMNYFFDQQQKYDLGLVNRPSTKELQEQVVETLITTALLEEVAKEYDVTVTDEELEAYYRDVIVPQEPRGEAAIEADVKEFYGWTPQEFQHNELYPVVLRSEIMDALKNDDLLNEEPLRRAQDIRNQIDANPSKSFSEFATEWSEDADTAKSGGMIGFIAKGQYDEAFENAAFALAVGEVSQPIRSEIGYHIIKVTDKDDDAGTVEVRHILIKTPSVDDLLKEKRDTAKIKKHIPR